ncbi:MAG TPA: glycosyltransferase [Acidimicrobiales bacterium]|nr:glycosyltransferase [Acidimicrobiales bacterium]
MSRAGAPAPALSAADVAVVIPSGPGWQRAAVLTRTLEGLASQSVSGFEVIVVVDDAATPPPPLAGRAGLRVVARSHSGPGPRRNAGARASDRTIVLMLGDDTIPARDCVERHVAAHNAHPDPVVAVLGRVDWHPETARGRIQRWLEWSGTQFDYDTIAGDDAGWGRFYASNLSIKRAFLLDVGGFDEDFSFGYEDTELGLRLHHKGMRLRYEPAARALHHHRYTLDALRRRFRLVGEGEYLMTRKHPEFSPYFLERIRARRRAPAWAPWPWLVDLVPRRGPAHGGTVARLRRALEVRADSWYFARVEDAFRAGWADAAARLDTAGAPAGRRR